MEDYVKDLEQKEEFIQAKLRQRWRLFGKRKLRKEMTELQILRERLVGGLIARMEEEIGHTRYELNCHQNRLFSHRNIFYIYKILK